MFRFDQATVSAKNNGAFDDVLQFADVAGPVVGLKHGQAAVGNAAGADAMFSGEPGHELLGQERDILHVVAQRRHVDGDDIEAEIKVLPEFLALDRIFQTAVGGGEDADIDLDGAVASDALKFAFLQDAEELGLDLRGDFADFVKKNGAAVGQLETAFALVERAGERTLFVAEEFAFNEVFRDGGAVDLDEWSIGPRALAVEGAGDEFLSGAAFAGDQDGGLGAGDFADELAQCFHGLALPLQFVAGVVLLGIAEIGVDLEKLVKIFGLLQGDGQLVGREGLEHVIKRAVAHAIDGRFDGAEPGDHDDEWLLGLGLYFAEQISAFAVWEADIKENEVKGVPGHQFPGAGNGVGGGDIVALLPQLLLEVATNNLVVFKDNDFFNRHLFPNCAMTCSDDTCTRHLVTDWGGDASSF